MIKKIDKVLSRITNVFGFVAIALLAVVILLISFDVLLRRFSGTNVKGAYEIVERLLLCIVFAGLSYTEMQRGHINVTMLISAFSRGIRFFIFGLMHLLSTAIGVYLAIAAYQQTLISAETKTVTSVLFIPLYPFFAVESICMVVFSVTLLWVGIKSFIAIKNDDLAAEIQGVWS